MNKQLSKKIGILTFWGVPNYGAFAQAYALNNYINQNFRENAVHIAWLHPKHYNSYFLLPKPKRSWRSLFSPGYYYSLLRYLFLRGNKLYPAFTRDWGLIPHYEIADAKQLENDYFDTIITGSDAIWEYSIKVFGDDEHLIGNNLNCKKLIAYAGSFGNMNITDTFPSFISAGLSKYDKISVRDENSKQIVESLTDSCPDLVLDPVLLWGKGWQEDVNIPESIYSSFILVYGDVFSDKTIEEIKRYASKHNLKIIGAGIAPEWCDIRLTDIGPLEWIGLFKKADFVLTCTFHGLMFSLLNEKKFYFNQIEYVKNRSQSLLEKTGLNELFSDKDLSVSYIFDMEWDYKGINRALDEMRQPSVAFLKEALEEDG